MYQTISTHKNKDLNSDTIEILNQIKKQTEEISTSEASIPFFKNLSNPTNLTNPQIIGTQKTSITNMQSPTFHKKDITKIKHRNLYKGKSDINIIKNELFSEKNFPSYLLRNDSTSVKDLKRNEISNELPEEKGICKTTKGKFRLEPIWDKIQKPLITQGRLKDIRINVRENSFVKKYIDGSKLVSLVKYNIDIKKEKYQQMKNIKESQLNMINKTEEKITLLQNVMLNNYNNNYVKYLRFLNNTLEKENQISYDLHNDIIILKNDINRLNTKISKLIEKKYKILKWIELLIEVKEQINSVPKYYFDIIEENDFYKIYKFKDKISKTSIFFMKNFSTLITKRIKTDKTLSESQSQEITISEPNRERIINYRYFLIFKNPEDFMSQYSILENSWISNVEKHHNFIKELNKLKNDLIELDKSKCFDDEKVLIEKLKINKNINFQLKNQYESLKAQNKNKIKKIKLDHISPKNSTASSPDIYSNIYEEIFNNLNFYNKKTFSPNKKKKSNSKELSDMLNTNLYKLIFDIFNIAKQNNLMKFDASNFMQNRNVNPIFDIMNYIEVIMNLLIEEKYKYLNDPKMKEKYKAIQKDLAKENKRLKILKLAKLQELKNGVKLKAMKERGIKRKYITTRKIDYNHYIKFKMLKMNKIKQEEIDKRLAEKKEPNIEDFLYDIK